MSSLNRRATGTEAPGHITAVTPLCFYSRPQNLPKYEHKLEFKRLAFEQLTSVNEPWEYIFHLK
jgi:hypothetical protein